MKTALLLDGDAIAYRYAVAAEEPIHWGDDIWTLHSFAGPINKQIDALIERMQDTLDADSVWIAFSGSENYRKDYEPNYKSNRKGMRKPVAYQGVLSHLRGSYVTDTVFNLEADDLMGIWATDPNTLPGYRKIICSPDKDMKQIPGFVFDYTRTSTQPTKISKEDADYLFLTQCLTGDKVDGYDGIKGVGPKTAEKILGANPTFLRVIQAYLDKGMTKEDARKTARCARILRHGEYDFETGEVNLYGV